MTTSYAQHVSTRQTPQSEPIPGKPMVANSAGGFSFAVDDWTRLDRFLILGNEGGSYYASERTLTQENASAVLRCVAADGARTVQVIRDVSVAGRAPKNDPAVFALALAAAHGDVATKHAAYLVMPEVCRTGTHLFAFVEACNELRGNGGGLHRAIKRWYADKAPRDVAYLVTKYQSRGGWSHRDVLRLVRPKATGALQDIFHWVVKGWPGVGEEPHPDEALLPIWAMEKAKRATTEQKIVRLVRDFRLVRECIPTQWLNSVAVWEAMLEGMPLTALVRSLAKMTAVGLLSPLSAAMDIVCTRLADAEAIRKARLHPLALLVAMKTYAQGKGDKGNLTWQPVQQVVDALDAAFYLAFGAVEATGKRWLLALDVSGSMDGGSIAGMAGITPRVGSAAMALVTAAVEKQHHLVGFSAPATGGHGGRWGGGTPGLTPLAITPRQRLDDVVQAMRRVPMGGTDCALPMLYATQQKIPVDVFCLYTDNETWHGTIHPCQALQQYRQKMGIPARLIVVSMLANAFTIADPTDAGMLDVIGFDLAVPQVMSNFARG